MYRVREEVGVSALEVVIRAFQTRFDSKVARTEGCWLWTGARLKLADGTPTYGVMMVTKGQTALAHRLAFELANGELRDDDVVCHRCDNPGCVRPDHLFIGTQRDNLADMRSKRRDRWAREGKRRGGAVIDDAKAREAVRLHDLGKSNREIAAAIGVSESTVWRFLTKRTRRVS